MPELTPWLIVFVRVSALFAVFPVISTTHVPIMLRTALAALASALTATALPPMSATHAPVSDLLLICLTEACIGLLLGFISRFVFHAAEMAGSIIANELALTSAFALNPGSGGMLPVPGVMLHWLGTALFFSLNLHAWLFLGIRKSYDVLAPGGAHLSTELAESVLALSGRIFVVALQMAAPILALSFVVSLVFAFLARMIPQMNVFSESFPFRIFAGMMVFGSTCSVMAQHLMNYLNRIPQDFQRILHLLAAQ
ncbi:MAG TPA: flagellar biosynthetic protein FliR [Methylomirabilota bacterium]|nr:flagellar biosynthetic protein FliR [Methylomirabilota bacterium]